MTEAKPWHILDKNKLATEQTAEIRMLLCLHCEYLTPVINMCTKCGCFMNVKTKIAKASCPINKWQEETEKSSGISD